MASCQVDFYILQRPGLDSGAFACMLAAKAWTEGNRVSVVAADPGQADRIDELLWSCPPGRFIPHARAGAALAGSAPVVVTLADRIADGGVVINLGAQPLPEPGRFDRLLEIVPQDPAARTASRDKFRHYRDQGLNPEHHEIS